MKRFLVLALVMSLSVQPVYAADAFEGWNEDTQEDALSVYTITEWSELGSALLFDRLNGEIKADVSMAVRLYESQILEVLEELNGGVYPGKDYVELMLAMMEAVGNPLSLSDPFQVNKWLDPDEEMTAEKSIQMVAQSLFEAENVYLDNYSTVSPYTNDGALQAVIQGVMFGTEYIEANQEYSLENARSWFDSHKSEYEEAGVEKDASFAEKVSKIYRTSGVAGEYHGTVTEEMERIVNVATSNTGTYPCTPGYCAAWVTGVYQAANASVIPSGNAIDMWNNYSDTGSTSMNNIPPGAIVCGSGEGSAGALFGHVGIYLGNGMVASNVGSHQIETLESWCSWQTANCQGHVGWIGWVYPGGVPE